MSVPIAVVGWIPKMRISSGVISEPPPMPVIPTSTPMPNPKRTIAGSIGSSCSSARTDFDFPDLLGQECGVRQDTKNEAGDCGYGTDFISGRRARQRDLVARCNPLLRRAPDPRSDRAGGQARRRRRPRRSLRLWQVDVAGADL